MPRRLPKLNEEDRRVIRRLFPTYGKKRLAKVWGISPRKVLAVVRCPVLTR